MTTGKKKKARLDILADASVKDEITAAAKRAGISRTAFMLQVSLAHARGDEAACRALAKFHKSLLD